MKLLLGWLTDFVDIPESPDDLAGILTEQGFEVEAIVPTASLFDRMVVGEILERESMGPDGGLLRCRVSVGRETVRTVCGDPRVRVGQRVPVALPGAELGTGARVRAGQVGGVESEAVLCSLFDLGLRSVQDEVHGFDGNPPVGSPVAPLLELEDHVFEIELTPNRGDCLSVIGMAREIAAATGRNFRAPEVKLRESARAAGDVARIRIEAGDLCPKYVGRIVEDIRVGPSPLWMTRRLRLMGLRPISNVVDVSNYVLLELGQPLHTFDHACLEEGTIVVRRGRPAETFVALDETAHTLNDETLVIADAARPVALAGIMGGVNSGVLDTTTTVLIESAHFDPVNIRKTARRLGMSTEASMRFERGIDPAGVGRAADRCAQLLAELAGGTVLAGRVEAGPGAGDRTAIPLRVARANIHLGLTLEPGEMAGLLRRLDFDVSGDSVLRVTPPTFRNDVEVEADLVEEVARMYGYSRIPVEMGKHADTPAAESGRSAVTEKTREVLGALGLNEAVTGTLREPQECLLLGGVGEEALRQLGLRNPLSMDQSVLRPSLVPGLVACARLNLNRRRSNVRLYEIGTAFHAGEGDRPAEAMHVAGVLAGLRDPVTWGSPPLPLDFYDLKGLLEDYGAGLRLPSVRFVPEASPLLDARFSVRVEVGPEAVGSAGLMDSRIAESAGIKEPLFLFELILDRIIDKALSLQKFKNLGRFPSVGRDLAVVVGEDVPFSQISGRIEQGGRPLLAGLHLFDVYRGKQVPDGKKSLAYSLIFRSESRTLTDEEVDGKLETIVRMLREDFGAALRSEV